MQPSLPARIGLTIILGRIITLTLAHIITAAITTDPTDTITDRAGITHTMGTTDTVLTTGTIDIIATADRAGITDNNGPTDTVYTTGTVGIVAIGAVTDIGNAMLPLSPFANWGVQRQAG